MKRRQNPGIMSLRFSPCPTKDMRGLLPEGVSHAMCTTKLKMPTAVIPALLVLVSRTGVIFTHLRTDDQAAGQRQSLTIKPDLGRLPEEAAKRYAAIKPR